MAEHRGPIDDPKRLGHELQNLRKAAGVSLEEIVAETKVSRSIFEALETGRYERLPEKVFCRNFLRQYADIVGCDQGPLVEGFDKAWEHFQEVSGTFATLKVDEPPRTQTRWWVWLPFLLAVLVLATLLVFAIRSTEGPDKLPPDPRRSNAERPTAIRALATPTPVVLDDVAAEPGGVSEGDGRVSAVLNVAAGKECWVHYRDRNGQVGEVLLGGGESTTLELAGPVLLTVGNADAASIVVDGTEFSDLGSAGEVVRFLLDDDGLKPLSGMPGNG